jgi:hypothetical protein
MAGPVSEDLLDAAREGDEHAYRRLVEPHQRELRAYCYRMLGSVHDAEDALQDALLGAWRGLPRFEGRSRPCCESRPPWLPGGRRVGDRSRVRRWGPDRRR